MTSQVTRPGRSVVAEVLADLDRERRYAAQLRGLARASLAINSALTLGEVLEIITDQARALIGAHQAVTSLLLSPERSQSNITVSFSDRYAAWEGFDIGQYGDGLATQVCRENRSIRLTQAELEAHPAWRNLQAASDRHPPLRGWLAAPLVGRDGRNLGLIQLSDREVDDFTPEDEAILVQLAQIASVAIENARLYDEAQQAAQARDEFISTVSHDLRNPLTAIKGFAQMLGRQVQRVGAGEAETRRLLEGVSRIEHGAARMAGMIDELLDVCRLQNGRLLDLDRHPVDLTALAQQVATEQQVAAGNRIRVQAPAEPVIGIWDATRLERVLTNLVSNALKYSPDDREVLIVVEPPVAGEATLQVRDQGIGIPAEDLPRIFERFHRGANVVGHYAGSGLGLSGSRLIVEQHGGTIHLESEEGVGTTVTLRLPLQ